MSKPETTFIRSINRRIPEVHAEKTNNPFRSGMADVWYSGNKGDLWVEYKFIPHVPKSASIKPNLSARQSRWLNNRYDEGRNIAVIVGTPDGGVIYLDKDWQQSINHDEFKARMIDRADIARWISCQVGVSQRKLQK